MVFLFLIQIKLVIRLFVTTVVVASVTSQEEGPRFNPWVDQGAFLCAVCKFSPYLHWLPLGSPISPRSPAHADWVNRLV